MMNKRIVLGLTLCVFNASVTLAQTTAGSIDARAVGASIIYNGTGAQTIPNAVAFTGQEIRNLTVNNNNLTAEGGSYLNLRGTLSLLNGTYTTAGSLYLYGNITYTNGKLQSGSNVVGILGTTGSQTVPMAIFPNNRVGKLYIKNSSGVTLTGAGSVLTELNLQSGTLTTGGTLTLNGIISYTSGNISLGTDTIRFAGIAAQTVPTGTFLSNTVGALDVSNSQGITSQGNLAISDALIASKLNVSTTALAATGKTVSISGSQLIVKGFNSVPTVGQVYTILSAGTLSGTFSSVSLPPGITGTISYPSNSVQLTIQGSNGLNAMSQSAVKDFNANTTRDGVALHWEVLNISSVKTIEIEKGKCADCLEKIAELHSPQSSLTDYSKSSDETIYYRLKIIAADGTVGYSKTVQTSTVTQMVIYPNPVASELNINHGAAGVGASITVYDTMGTRVYTGGVAKNSTQSTINVQRLNPGFYSLVFSNNGKKYAKIFIKQTQISSRQ